MKKNLFVLSAILLVMAAQAQQKDPQKAADTTTMKAASYNAPFQVSFTMAEWNNVFYIFRLSGAEHSLVENMKEKISRQLQQQVARQSSDTTGMKK